MGSRYGLQLRAATSADAPGLAKLMGAAGQAVDVMVLAARLDALQLQPGTALVALEWGPPSGLIVAHWYSTLNADLPVAQISTLLVGPDERRRGIGRALLKAAAQASRSAGCGTLHLRVPPGDTSLRRFCDATGFDEAATDFNRQLRKRGGPGEPNRSASTVPPGARA